MAEKFLSLAAMQKIFEKAKISRSSDDAKLALRLILEDYGVAVSKKAIEFAKHAGRKTVKRSDIKLAIENIGKLKK